MAASSVSYPAPIVVSPPEGGETKAVCIFLHGLGDTGHGWADVAGQMPFEGVKWIFPTAPTIPITLNGGMRMTSWYDILSLDRPSTLSVAESRKFVSQEEIRDSVAIVTALVEQEVQLLAGQHDKVFIGGFS